MFVILGRDAMSDCEEGLTEYLKGVWAQDPSRTFGNAWHYHSDESSVCYDCITKALEK